MADLEAYLLAVALVVGPLAVGVVTGRVVRRLRRGRVGWIAGALLVGVPLLATLAFDPTAEQRLGYWDLLAMALLVGAGALVAARRASLRCERRAVAVVLASCAVAAVLLEGGARLLLPTPPAFPPPREAQLVVRRWLLPMSLEMTWEMLWPDLHAQQYQERIRHVAGAGSSVLHVGDSMVQGSFVERPQTFVARLNEIMPGVAHVNAGVGGAGPDYYLLLLRAWLPRLRPAIVVVHFFLGNDVADIDYPYACCRDGPLLEYTARGPVARCPRPDFSRLVTSPRLGSPAPYPLRVATSFSHAARHLAAAFWRAQASGSNPDDEATWDRLGAILQAMADEARRHGTALVLVLLPSRWAMDGVLDSRPKVRARGERVSRLAAAKGIPLLDAWSLFEQADGSTGRWFNNNPANDVHFSPAGHERFARWLAERLERTAGVTLRREPRRAGPTQPRP